jgi:hypothetical protein
LCVILMIPWNRCFHESRDGRTKRQRCCCDPLLS